MNVCILKRMAYTTGVCMVALCAKAFFCSECSASVLCTPNPSDTDFPLPAGYIPLEYLRGTGTQYIDTRYNLTSHSRVEIDFSLSKIGVSTLPYGSSSAIGGACQHFLYINGTDKEWTVAVGYDYPSWPKYPALEGPAALGHHRVVVNDNGRHDFDGHVLETTPEEFVFSHSAYIFARHDPDDVVSRIAAGMDLYAFDIYEDGVLVRSFRPAKRLDDGTQGLWESKTGDFYENAGDGSFDTPMNFIRVVGFPEDSGKRCDFVQNMIIGEASVFRAPPCADGRACRGWRLVRLDGSVSTGGGDYVILTYTEKEAGATLEWIWDSDALPKEYLPLDCLRGSGTQYIDTCYKLTDKSHVDIDFTLYDKADTSALPFGAAGSTGSDHYFLYVSCSEKKWCACVGGVWSYCEQEKPVLLGKHRFTVNNNHYNLMDGVKQFIRTLPGAFTSPVSAYIFARNDAGSPARICKMDLRACDIYEDGKLARSFMPAMRRADHVAGLYERIEGTFYENAGTDSFEPTGGFIRISGYPAAYGEPTPNYGYASGRKEGEEYVSSAPVTYTTPQGVKAKCVGWRFTRLDGSMVSGKGNEARLVHTAADDGGTLEWQWKESINPSHRGGRRAVLRVNKNAYNGVKLAGFPLLVRVSPDRISGFAYRHCAANGENVWFSDSPDGRSALPSEIDNWNSQGESTFWVRVPTLDENTQLYMFWGVPPPAASEGALWGDYVGVWHFNSFVNGKFVDATGMGNALSPTEVGQVFETDGAISRIGRAKSGVGSLKLADYLTLVAQMNGGNRGLASLSGWFYAPSFAQKNEAYTFRPFSAFQSNDLKGWFVESTRPCEMRLSYKNKGSRFVEARQLSDYRTGWVHLAIVSDAETGFWYAYVNGKRFSWQIGDDVLDTEVGQALEVQGDYLDELRLRTSASTDDWINAEYLQGANDDFLIYGDAERVSVPGLMIIMR